MKSVKINGAEQHLRPCTSTHMSNLDVFLFASLSNNGNCIDTDIEGVSSLEVIHESLELWAINSNGCIGELLAHVNHKELSEDCFRNLGWLLSGIAELQNVLVDAGVTLQETRVDLEAAKN